MYIAEDPGSFLLIVMPSQTRRSPSKLSWALSLFSRLAHENLKGWKIEIRYVDKTEKKSQKVL